MEKEKLSWEKISKILKNELGKTKHILTFGTIGSCNIENDIDVIITKKPNSSSANFFKEVHSIFDKIDKYLKTKYQSKVIRLSGLSFQGELLNFINIEKNDIIFHSMVYVSLPQIIEEWKPWTEKNNNVSKILKENYKCMLGNPNDLFKENFNKENYYDFLFTFLAHYDRINFPYTKKTFIEMMNKFYYYLFKKRLNLNPPTIRSEKDARKYFYELCDILDNLNKEKEAK
jgi:hypothetical protein